MTEFFHGEPNPAINGKQYLKDQLVPLDILAGVNDTGVDGNYTNYLAGALSMAQSPYFTKEEILEAFDTTNLPTYTEYMTGTDNLRARVRFSPETTDDEKERILSLLTGVEGAVEMDKIAEEFRAISKQDPQSPEAVKRLIKLRCDAEYAAYGFDRGDIVSTQNGLPLRPRSR